MVADEIKQISAVPGVENKDPVLQQISGNYDKNGSPYLLLTDFRYGSRPAPSFSARASRRCCSARRTRPRSARSSTPASRPGSSPAPEPRQR